MKPSTRLRPVIDQAREREQAAARLLAEVLTRLGQATDKLTELENYRNEYVEGLHYKTQSGLNALQMKDYQVFLGRLDMAIRQQQQVLAGLEQEAGHARENWLSEKQRLGALDKLSDRHRQQELVDSERREQAETNEHALRRWRRAPG